MRRLVDVNMEIRTLDVSVRGGIWLTLNVFNVRCWTADGLSFRRADALRIMPYVGVLMPAGGGTGSDNDSGAYVRNDALIQDVAYEISAQVLAHLADTVPEARRSGVDPDEMPGRPLSLRGVGLVKAYRSRVAFGASVRAIAGLAISNSLKELVGIQPNEASKHVHSVISKIDKEMDEAISSVLLGLRDEDPHLSFRNLADGSVFNQRFADVKSIVDVKAVPFSNKNWQVGKGGEHA